MGVGVGVGERCGIVALPISPHLLGYIQEDDVGLGEGMKGVEVVTVWGLNVVVV